MANDLLHEAMHALGAPNHTENGVLFGHNGDLYAGATLIYTSEPYSYLNMGASQSCLIARPPVAPQVTMSCNAPRAILMVSAAIAPCLTAAQVNTTISPLRHPLTSRDSALDGTASERAQIAVSVARYRNAVIGDTARFDYCAVLSIVGDSVSLVAALPTASDTRSLLRDINSCTRDERAKSISGFLNRTGIVIDSINIKGMPPFAFVLGRNGGAIHHETYSLTRRSTRETFEVFEARFGGLLFTKH
ncbi:MAG: hypothetical protein ABJB74_13990 [Gemmatimonas sp.]